MHLPDPIVLERRSALVRAARRLLDEAGPDAGVLVNPALAVELVTAVSEDVATEIDRRLAGGVDTLEDLVSALLEGAIAAQQPYTEAMALISAAMERTTDYDQWLAVAAPWSAAVERALRRGQARGLVTPEVDAAATGLIVRDTMQRFAQFGMRVGPDAYRATVTRFLVAALRPED